MQEINYITSRTKFWKRKRWDAEYMWKIRLLPKSEALVKRTRGFKERCEVIVDNWEKSLLAYFFLLVIRGFLTHYKQVRWENRWFYLEQGTPIFISDLGGSSVSGDVKINEKVIKLWECLLRWHWGSCQMRKVRKQGDRSLNSLICIWVLRLPCVIRALRRKLWASCQRFSVTRWLL